MLSSRHFFLAYASFLLLLILVAFAPTFYFHRAFEKPTPPRYLMWHGVILTTWFVWLVIQAAMIRAGKRQIHKRLGVIGIGIATATIFSGLLAVWNFPKRLAVRNGGLEEHLSEISGIFWADLGLLTAFAILITAAMIYRRVPHLHRRLILIASIGITLPALARFAHFGPLPLPEPVFVLGGLIALPLAIVIYDALTLRQLHKATMWGIAVLFTLFVASGLVIGQSSPGRHFVAWVSDAPNG